MAGSRAMKELKQGYAKGGSVNKKAPWSGAGKSAPMPVLKGDKVKTNTPVVDQGESGEPTSSDIKGFYKKMKSK